MNETYGTLMEEQLKDKSVRIDVDKLEVHKQLKVKRVYDGMTQPQLAKVLGATSVPTISKIEKGKIPIPYYLKESIYKYLYEEDSGND
ncbi:helix-turn-helix transcriptional regulator [Bacillus paranthracis]|uniref:helix-turn-helix transcriptional regulator n=1 Tax=Bacillus paranthracis TaxID=2026186 RepID=UPI002D77DA8B|nr:helix-turn-helix transcriptional regulator [Bacillus paranthracis]